MLEAAQSCVSRARRELLNPRTCDLEACNRLFRQAQKHVEELRDTMHREGDAGRELRERGAALSGEIRQAAILIEQAARLGRHWLNRLESMNPGYTPAGCWSPVISRGHVCVTG